MYKHFHAYVIYEHNQSSPCEYLSKPARPHTMIYIPGNRRKNVLFNGVLRTWFNQLWAFVMFQLISIYIDI